MTHPTDALRLVPDDQLAALIQQADDGFGYIMEMVRLVDGVRTYRLKIEGQEAVEITDGEDNDYESIEACYALVKAAKNKVRADAIRTALAAPASPLPEGGGQCSGISGQLKSPDLDALEKLADEATPGEWTVYGERIDSNRMLAAEEALAQVNLTEQVSSHFWMLNADGKCPALTGCGPTSEANAAFIAAANPATIKAMIAELKEARGLVEQSIDLMTDEYEDTRAHQEQARAFLARNGKGEG